MSRLLIIIIFFSFLFSFCTQKKRATQTISKPNIVVILADDMGYGDVEAFNAQSKIPTPHLNKLAEEGMSFTDAHTNSAVCTPTRYGVLTGRYTWRTRLKHGVLSGYSNHLIDTGRTTVAKMLHRSGYFTGVIGKWHLGVDYPWISGHFPEGGDNLNYCATKEIDYTKRVKNGPNQLGFDYSFIVPGSLDMSPYVFLENGRATAVPDSISPRVNFPAFTRKGEIAPDFVHQHVLDTLTRRAVNYIKYHATGAQPFFLYLTLTGPHKPALPAARFAGKSGYGPYGDMVMQVDWSVGEVIKALKESKVEDNTVVIYTSDNGSYMYRIKANLPDHVDSAAVQGYHVDRRQANYIWRGTKADIYDGGHRVPFMVRWPTKIVENSKSQKTICLTDIMATLADISGSHLGDNEGPDSFSFLNSLRGEEQTKRPPVIHHSVNGSFSVRDGKWKLILTNGSGGRQRPVGKPFGEPYQLYDMQQDPSETQNVIDGHEAEVKSLTQYLQHIREAGTSK